MTTLVQVRSVAACDASSGGVGSATGADEGAELEAAPQPSDAVSDTAKRSTTTRGIITRQ